MVGNRRIYSPESGSKMLANIFFARARIPFVLAILVVTATAPALACGGGESEPILDPSPTPAATPTATPRPDPTATLSYSGLPVIWVRQFGSDATDLALDLALDVEGHPYVTGTTAGELPDQSNVGSRDAFVRRYNSDGSVAWTVQFGTSGAEIANGISVDSQGDIYVVGSTTGMLSGHPNAGGKDAFVQKLDPSGGQIWTRQFGTGEEDEALKVSVDGSGYALVVGVTSGVLTDQTAIGGQDIFLSKVDSAGQEVWTVQLGTDRPDMVNDITVDDLDNIYIAGTVEGALQGQVHYGIGDAFVRKYSPDGLELWTIQFGTFREDNAFAVAVDKDGNVYVGGGTGGTLTEQESAGADDAFLRKYDSAGNQLWTVQFGSNSEDEIRGLAFDSDGNIQTTGWTLGMLVGTSTAVGADSFLTTYDPSGTELVRIQLLSTPFDKTTAIASASSGEIYITGRTEDALPTQSKLGSTDAFLIQIVLE